MASKMGYYNVEDSIKQKRQQEREAKVPPKANFLAAANHIRNLFEGKLFAYGIMGGLEMLCLGHRREMPNLQIAYDDKDFQRIKAKLEADQRVRLPDGMNSLFPAKILVRTGPAYKDEGCTQAADIEVDLVPPRSHGTPPNGSLASNLVLLSLKTEGKLRSYKGLNMLYLVRTLVHYCIVRDLAWDPRKDILFLCQHYGEEVRSIRNQLDQKTVQQNFLGTSFLSRLSPEDQRRCYHVLLGTEPPPTMAITPPAPFSGHKHSASASDIATRPRVSSHKSSPSLNVRNSPELLSPPLPGKPKAARERVQSAEHRPSELPTSSGVQTRTPSDMAAAARDSRSRYRPISAPTTREVSPIDGHTKPQDTVHVRQISQQPATSTSKVPFQDIQQRSNYQPQLPSHLAPAAMAAQGRRSMPHMNTGYTGPLAPYSFAQTPSLNGLGTYPQPSQSYISPIEMSATPVPLNPGQQYMKSQLGLGGDYLPRQHLGGSFPITERPMPPQARIALHGQQTIRAELSATPLPGVQARRSYLANPNVQPATTARESSSKSHLVRAESEAIYSASQSPPSITQPAQGEYVNTQSTSSAPVELDAMSQLGQFITELSVEQSTPAPEQFFEQQTHQHLHSEPARQAHPTHSTNTAFQGSPVSPPDSHVVPITQSQHEDIIIRPLNPRPQSASLAALPASLMAGGSIPQQRPPSNSIPHPPTTTSDVPTTNASKYTRYYASQTPPSSTPNSAHTSPQPGPGATYKAYHPLTMALSSPAIPLSPPASDRQSRPMDFGALKDVDGATGYFKAHRRDASHDSHVSNASHDSSKLAMEYQAALPGFGEGYAAPGRS